MSAQISAGSKTPDVEQPTPSMPAGWLRRFEDPIPLPRGRELVTLKDAASHIMKLPTAEQNLPEWQVATEVLIMAAEGRVPLMHAHIGVMRALNAGSRMRHRRRAGNVRGPARSFGDGRPGHRRSRQH
jgi:hypothetical protein